MILKFFNLVIRISLIFLICLVWMRYFVDELWLSILYTALLTISIELILHFIFLKRHNKRAMKSEDEKLAEKISTTFIFSHESCMKYFYNLCNINYNAKKYAKYILIDGKKDYPDKEKLGENKTILFPCYSYTEVSPQSLVEIMKKIEKQNIKKLVVCGYKIEPATYKLAEQIKQFKVILLDSKNCFLKLIKPHNFYPPDLKEFSLKEKLKFRDFLLLFVARKNSKGFFIASLLLLFSSFVVRLNIYYVIMSSLLLLLSLVSFFLPKNSVKIEDSVL